MRNQIIASVVIALVLTVGVIAGAIYLLRDTDAASTSADAEGTTTAAVAQQSEDEVPDRPDCPADGVGGVALDCLGGDNGAGDSDAEVTVVNVWAWWCGPCRDELPYIEEYAQAHPEVEVVGVHADTMAGHGAAMLNEMGLSLPSYQDYDNSFAGSLGLPSVIPITVVFRGEEQVGMFPTPFESVAEIEEAVASALAA